MFFLKSKGLIICLASYGKPMVLWKIMGNSTLITGWWFGTMFFLFSPIVGMMIQSDELIFFRGVETNN